MAKEKVQDSSQQFIKYVLKHLVAAVTLHLILTLSCDKWSRLDLFMDAIAERITSNRRFMEPTMTPVIERMSVFAESKLDSTSHDRCRSISPPLRLFSECGNDSSHVEDRAGRSLLSSKSKKGQRG